MKRLPLVVVVLLITTALGAGVAPLSGGTGGVEQADAVDIEPSYAVDVDPSYAAQVSSPVGSDTVESNTNVTNVLAIPAGEIARSDVRRQHADLGPAAGFATGVTTDRLVTRTIERELAATASDDELQSQISDEISVVETEIDTLENRERSTIRAFSREEIAPKELLVELATIHLKASALRERTAMLESQAATLPEGAISGGRLQQIEYDLRMLEGPLRAHAVSVLRGERPTNRIMIETSDTAIALTAIDDTQYVREINRKEIRGEGLSQLTPERTEELTQQEYPVLWNRSTSWSTDGPGSVFMMSVSFDRGGLQTFIDGPTERTFIEHQRLPLDTVLTGTETTKTQDGLNVTVEQTYAGGPLRLTVTDASTGEPVEATVTIGQDGQDSQEVGITNDAGSLWAISPRGSFTITVFGEGTSAAFIDITPPAPETVTTAE